MAERDVNTEPSPSGKVSRRGRDGWVLHNESATPPLMGSAPKDPSIPSDNYLFPSKKFVVQAPASVERFQCNRLSAAVDQRPRIESQGDSAMSIDTLTSHVGSLASASPFSELANGLTQTSQTQPVGAVGGESFAGMLHDALSSVNATQVSAEQAATDFALGKVTDVHSVMIAAQKASVALSLTTQVRNKVVEAYQSVMQMSM